MLESSEAGLGGKMGSKFHIFLAAIFILSGVFQPLYSDTEAVLQKGETLYRLAKRYGVPLDLILKLNQIDDPTNVPAGAKIKIPGVYTIKKGDNLYRISKNYNISVEELCRLNEISDYSSLKPGQTLLIPGNRIEQTPGPTTNPGPAGGHYKWPHPGKREPLEGILKGGVAIIGNPGDPVYAVTEGRVIWANPYRGYGKAVFVKSHDGHIIVYGGNENLLVATGDKVSGQMKIAEVGKNAHDGVAKLYFLVYKNGRPVKPETILPKK